MPTTLTNARLRSRVGAARTPGWLARLLAAPALRRERAQLARLSDAALRDIGVTAQEADAEARRPAWDAPNHWHR